ncbi:MAG: four helix bundle protein [Candidatus Magasanikbacteria bacterium]|nr:four helix bundle protein [Candidatus Magasanikbacteria bacterium]
MNQLPFHNQNIAFINPPPSRINTDLPILMKLNESYKLWHGFLIHLPRLTRFTLGTKIDNLFTDCLELSLLAGYTSKIEKVGTVQKLSTKFDALKFFLKVAWELKALDTNKYTTLSNSLTPIGKMIGGWLNMFKT